MDDIRVQCPKCGTGYRLPQGFSRSSATCKKCGATIPVSAPAAQASSARPSRAGARPSSTHSAPAGTSRRHFAVGGVTEAARKNMLPVYVICSALAVVSLIVIAIMLPKTRAPQFAAPRDSSSKPVAAAPPSAMPKPAPPPVEAPAPAPAPKKKELTQEEIDWGTSNKLQAVDHGVDPRRKVTLFPPQPLEHLPDTSPELRAEIDSEIKNVLNLSTPAAGSQSAVNLVAIGKPAIPIILTAFHGLKMDNSDDVLCGNMLNQMLLGITKRYSLYTPEAPGDPDMVAQREKSREGWFQWWSENKDKFGSTVAAGEK